VPYRRAVIITVAVYGSVAADRKMDDVGSNMAKNGILGLTRGWAWDRARNAVVRQGALTINRHSRHALGSRVDHCTR